MFGTQVSKSVRPGQRGQETTLGLRGLREECVQEQRAGRWGGAGEPALPPASRCRGRLLLEDFWATPCCSVARAGSFPEGHSRAACPRQRHRPAVLESPRTPVGSVPVKLWHPRSTWPRLTPQRPGPHRPLPLRCPVPLQADQSCPLTSSSPGSCGWAAGDNSTHGGGVGGSSWPPS